MSNTPPADDAQPLAARVRQLEQELAALKHQQAVLLDRDTRYQYAMEATNDGLWDWHIPSGKIYFNRSYLRMLGYDYGDLPGNLSTLRDYFIHPDDMDDLFTEYNTALDNRRDSVQLQMRMLHREGAIIWVHAKAKFFEPDDKGRATRCVGINTDISDFIKTRQELISAKAEADLANSTKSEFLARISHEIRTPMNAIIGMGYLLQDTDLDEQQHSYLCSMHSAADSLLQIINQLLDFSKIEAGRVMLDYAHFDLEQLCEKISRLFEISALHRNVNIVYDIQPDVPRFLRGDASRLSQILNHLINNAFQYSRTNQVVVRIAKKKHHHKQLLLEFTVQDQGIGMSPQQLDAIQQRLLFSKNQSLDDKALGQINTRGLSICNHLVHLMQGDFAIAASPQKGCKVTFSVLLEHSRLGEKALLNPPRQLQQLRALIVDDSKIARTIIASTARSLQLQVDEESDPLTALTRIQYAEQQGKGYHFVLLDYRMPGMNGLQLTQRIKSDAQLQQPPWVFLISGYHRDELLNQSENPTTDAQAVAQVDEFLTKPVSESRLYDAISQTIAQAPALQQISPLQVNDSDSKKLLAQRHILIAEDNLVNQQVLRGILKKQQVQCHIAANGIEALALLANASEPFAAILMDLEMPEMDGLEATRHIRAGAVQAPFDVSQIPIIAVTAQAMRGDRERCLAAGMNGYLSKPVNPELLYSTLADILRSQSLTNSHSHS